MTTARGIPPVTEPAPASIRDGTLLPATLDRYTALETALGPLSEHPLRPWMPDTTTARSTTTCPTAGSRPASPHAA
ncbi:hypothetical protein GCM10010502_73270 [Kitasatospora aureofaciens]|uniref:Uncharacterized protein n=1 Tax=Kitasatospora aureofaciens TaxID=1894 RepID=A0A8H9HZQ8_KITAU|nr:hypothetical protein GCM10010502_73270 [Kitasatospora aureofaciens]